MFFSTRSPWLSLTLTVFFLLGCQKNEQAGPVKSTTSHAKRVYVVLGSSTAAGAGAGVYDSSWVGRTIKHLPSTKTYKADSIINLAVGGYTSFNILPSGNANHNITKALNYKPFAVIVNMPSNDIANGISVDAQMRNFATIADLCRQQNVELWVTTSQPRNLSSDGRARLLDLKDRVLAVYGNHSIDFWTGLAEPDGTIKATYDIGDGIHLNASGHRAFFARVAERVFKE
jgi:lysophospholipase L1-like esterase